jgi:hypothetical protein
MSKQNEIRPTPGDTLTEVCTILRHNNRHDLASLLSHSSLVIDFYDLGFAIAGDGDILFSNAVVYAPLSDLDKLRSLKVDDNNAILDAIRELWPLGETGGTYINNVEYKLDSSPLRDEPLTLFDSPTGWERVDRSKDGLRHQLTAASTEEEFQQVGHLCRETLISLAQAVFDPQRHPPLDGDGKNIGSTDVKGMMDQYLAAEFGGSSNEELRKCIRSALNLANAVQHGRNSSYREAALCVQAAFNLIGLVEVIAGKRTHAV